MNLFELNSLPVDAPDLSGEFDLLRSSVSLFLCF